MENFIELLLQPFKDFWAALVGFIPNLLAMLIIICGGFFVAWVAKSVLNKAFIALSFDKWCDRAGVTAMARKANVWSKPSDILITAVYWFLVIMFLMVGLTALRLQAIDSLTMQFFMYLPRAFSALLILVIGYVLTGFVSRARSDSGRKRRLSLRKAPCRGRKDAACRSDTRHGARAA